MNDEKDIPNALHRNLRAFHSGWLQLDTAEDRRFLSGRSDQLL